jgi:hypothetical protein
MKGQSADTVLDAKSCTLKWPQLSFLVINVAIAVELVAQDTVFLRQVLDSA